MKTNSLIGILILLTGAVQLFSQNGDYREVTNVGTDFFVAFGRNNCNPVLTTDPVSGDNTGKKVIIN